jgi:hypothetical protein
LNPFACSAVRACGSTGAALASSSSAVAPAITWTAFAKNSVVIRASRLFLPKP